MKLNLIYYNKLELLRRIDEFYCSSNPPALEFKTKPCKSGHALQNICSNGEKENDVGERQIYS